MFLKSVILKFLNTRGLVFQREDSFRPDIMHLEFSIPALRKFKTNASHCILLNSMAISVAYKPLSLCSYIISLNPLYTGIPLCCIFASSEDPGEMSQNVAFHP